MCLRLLRQNRWILIKKLLPYVINSLSNCQYIFPFSKYILTTTLRNDMLTTRTNGGKIVWS